MMAGVSDLELDMLSERLGNNTKLRRLGLLLNLRNHDIDLFLEMNYSGGRITAKGTSALLRKWAENTPMSRQRGELKDALENAELVAIAEEIFGNDSSSAVDTSGAGGNMTGSSGSGITQTGATINVNLGDVTTSASINIIGQQATINRR